MSRLLTFERASAFAAELIRIPSPPGAEGDAARRAVREMEALGFDDVWEDAVGNVIGRIRGRGAAPPLMFCSHLDVVDEGDPAGWEHPPYAGVVADGHLHGRGAMDVKGQLALQLYAAATFTESRPAGDIYVACTVLEERGCWGMAHIMESGGVRPAVILLGEATGGDVCVGHRGHAELEVEIRGRAAHASAPERARNPLAALPRVLDALAAFAGRLPEHPVLGASTLAPTLVETRPRSRNAVPELARVVVDWRVLPGWDEEEAVRQLRALLSAEAAPPEGISVEVRTAVERQRTYTGVEEDRHVFTPGFLVDSRHPLVRAAVRALATATGRLPAVRPWTFATDGGYSCGAHGIPTLGFSPGDEAAAHTNRERLPLDEARTAYRAYPALVRALQDTLARGESDDARRAAPALAAVP
ncbi:MAG: M20/M25/M40 family metallo-hydrolase [Gemmatimonadetes bacterium]|nr:M20/M25/M40 family metallo-hydrolase [Gemmatimonadota bacterium]